MDKSKLYKQEHQKLIKYKTYLNPKNNKGLAINYELMYKDYEELIKEATFIAKYSDRLQNKLTLAHKESVKNNHILKEKNELLNTTVKELNKAKIGNRATTYVVIIAVILFVLDEGFFEPWLESKTNQGYVTWGFKIGFVLMLKPIEMMVEKLLLSQKRMRITRFINNRTNNKRN